ncbi:TrmB family transcriptional regulator [Candidatus Nomurabacteria bacterium]|nr:TrmB family transcriptional regulator [Candidatus Nomurabacteria bacterium]
MPNQANTLQKLGLSDKESRVYLGLLTLGQGSANAVARAAGLKRPTTYVVLEDLRKRGLVLKMPGSKKQMFRAQSPDDFVHEVKRGIAEAENLLPELMREFANNTSRVKTTHFEGIAGLEQAMEYGFAENKNKEVVGFYATSEHLPKELTDYFTEWNEKRHKINITMRGIAPEHASLEEYRKRDAQIGAKFKTVPHQQFSSQIAMDVIGNCVRIHDYKNLQGIVLENAEVAKTVKEIFEMVWQKI